MGLIGSLSNAFYTPQQNPYFGSQQVTDSNGNKRWIDVNGNDVTEQLGSLPANLQQKAVSTPFDNPGFWSSLGSLGQGVKQVNIQAQEYPGSVSQQTIGSIDRANSWLGQPTGTKMFGALTGSLNPQAGDTYLTTQAKENSGFYPAQAQAETQQAGTIAAQNTPSAYPLIASNALREASTVTPYTQLAREAQALNPGLGEAGSLQIAHIDPNTGLIGSVTNPIKTPASLMYGQAMSGSTPYTTSSGTSYMKAPAQASVAPLYGTSQNQGATIPTPNVQPTGQVRPLYGIDGYSIDSSGNLFYGNEYVPEENIKGTPIEKALNHQLDLEKKIKNTIGTHDKSHGLGFEVGNTIATLRDAPWGPYDTIRRAYHGIVGE